jgi:hypothetical protein
MPLHCFGRAASVGCGHRVGRALFLAIGSLPAARGAVRPEREYKRHSGQNDVDRMTTQPAVTLGMLSCNGRSLDSRRDRLRGGRLGRLGSVLARSLLRFIRSGLSLRCRLSLSRRRLGPRGGLRKRLLGLRFLLGLLAFEVVRHASEFPFLAGRGIIDAVDPFVLKAGGAEDRAPGKAFHVARFDGSRSRHSTAAPSTFRSSNDSAASDIAPVSSRYRSNLRSLHFEQARRFSASPADATSFAMTSLLDPME